MNFYVLLLRRNGEFAQIKEKEFYTKIFERKEIKIISFMVTKKVNDAERYYNKRSFLNVI